MTGLSLPDGYTLHAPGLRTQPHLCGEVTMIAADLSVSGHEQAERTCRNCGAVKVTVLAPGLPWREWRCTADGPQSVDAPPCPQDRGVAR